MLARSIGLMGEDQLVRVDPVEFVPAAQRVDVEPVSADDWEILSMHAEYLEVVFLQQISGGFCWRLLIIFFMFCRL